MGKGPHAALNQAQAWARQYRYALHGDIVKYFASIDHQILYALISGKIADRQTLWLIKTFLDSGAGIQAGFYNMDVTANGSYASLNFQRSTQTTFAAAPAIASLQETYTTQPVDADLNGLYEALEIQTGITVTQAGTYSLSARLEGGGGQFIDLASSMINAAAPGAYPATLRFSGEAVKAARLDGPYFLTNATILDDNSFE